MADVTKLIQSMASGDETAEGELYELIYKQLRMMAAKRMATERKNHTLDPTALVNEVYLRLISAQSPNWENRRHFFGVASEAMRRILIDRARATSAQKRGGDRDREMLLDDHAIAKPLSQEWLDVDIALTELEKQAPEKAELVKLHVFSGLSLPKCAEAMGTSLSTIERNWRFAKGWLKLKIQELD